jgi:hypothetical protein
MLMPVEAAACHVCAATPGTKVAAAKPMVGTFQLMSPTSVEAPGPLPALVVRGWMILVRSREGDGFGAQGRLQLGREVFLLRVHGPAADLFEILLGDGSECIIGDDAGVGVDDLDVDCGACHEGCRRVELLFS